MMKIGQTYVDRYLDFDCLGQVQGYIADVHKNKCKRDEEDALVTKLPCQIRPTNGTETERQSKGGKG